MNRIAAPPLLWSRLSLILIVSLFAGFPGIGFVSTASAGERIGLLLDQPAQKAIETESSIVVEIARRIGKSLDASVEVYFVSESNGIVTDSGVSVTDATVAESFLSLNRLWVHQGDVIRQSGPLFAQKTIDQIQSYRARGGYILLTGGAPALLKSLGAENQTVEALTFGNDRNQTGIVPRRYGDFPWVGTVSDRGVVWGTNAVFPAFASFSASGGLNLKPLGMNPPGGQNNPMYISVDQFEGKTSVVITLNWQISLMYDWADEHFRFNVETVLKNLISWVPDEVGMKRLDEPADRYDPLPFDSIRRAINDLIASSASTAGGYPQGNEYLGRLDELEKQYAADPAAFEPSGSGRAALVALQREALLANPLLDFDRIMYIRRKASSLGLPQNYNSNSVLAPSGYDNTIRAFSFKTTPNADTQDGTTKEDDVLFTPPGNLFVGDMDLHFDGEKVLFSMPQPADIADTPANRWRLWELNLTTGDYSRVETIPDPDVDNYDGCYTPDEGLVFCSTACFTGVPCIDGSGHVCNLYRKNPDGTVRQMTLEQDHDWCPTLMNNGRIMYLRWEYSDLPHAFSRILFHCNPDGTNQSEYYGSNSYWPGAMFYARPIPNDPVKFVAIIGGHHEQNRIGDLVLFDPSKGRKETQGAVQRIPGWDKPVCRQVLDLPISQSFPQFIHPFPLSDKYFLVSTRLTSGGPWTICLVDVFDNIVPLKTEPGYACFEPVPLRKTARPPVLMDRTDYDRQEADVFIADIYQGEGLKDVPRGTVKALRLVTYQFSYQGMGAEPHSVGLDGPWDPKIVLGTVPVYDDGSAHFTIPALTPVSFQPLDGEGKAIQLMRSWVTALPGESVSCVGCHEQQNSVPPPARLSKASRTAPKPMTPFVPSGKRGFTFQTDVQPILDKYCVDCHRQPLDKVLAEVGKDNTNGLSELVRFDNGPVAPALNNGNYINKMSRFSQSYYNLRRYVRTPTKESQMDILKPYEFYAGTSLLMRILESGHYGVELDRDSMDKLTTWIDLNCPYYGSWGEIRNYSIPDRVKGQWTRRAALRKLYGGITEPLDDDPTTIAGNSSADAPTNLQTTDFGPKTWTEDSASSTVESGTAVADDVGAVRIPVGEGVEITVRPIPGTDLLMGVTEVTNEQYRHFDPTHDSGFEFGDFIHFSPGEAGHLLNRPAQPVVRITQTEAKAYCEWLSAKTGRKVTLPTADEWTRAAAAGTVTPVWFGGWSTSYSQTENLADAALSRINPFSWSGREDTLPRWRICDTQVNDRNRVSSEVSAYGYRPNPWGFYDMVGNVSEWTDDDSPKNDGRKVICGGSWSTPLRYSSAETARYYWPHQCGYDVGFRIIVRP